LSGKKRSISWYYDLAQRVLRLWVRFRTYPETATHLGLLAEPGAPLVYFMQVRQLTDLLVLDEATQRLGLNSPFSPSPLDSRSGFYLSRTGQPSPLQRRPYR
jgi:glycerol-3-phosphate O-acyltransferase